MIVHLSRVMVVGVGVGVFALAGLVGGAQAAKGSRYYGKVISMRSATRGTRVVINRGRKHGVRTGTRAYLLRGGSNRTLTIDGKRVSFKVESATWTESVGHVRLTQDTIKLHRRVKLSGLGSTRTKRRARVVWVQGATGGGVRVVINRGRRAGLRAGTKVYFLRGDTDDRLRAEGRSVSFRCETVTRDECRGRVMMTLDQVKANRYVKPLGRRG